MEKMTLTPRLIDNMPMGVIYGDAKTDGLSVDTLKGSAKWRFKRKVKGTNRVIKQTLGSFPALSIADARLSAAELNAACEKGIDPSRQRSADAMTVGEAHALYMRHVEAGVRKTLKASTIKSKRDLAKLMSSLWERPLPDVTDDELWQVVEARAEISKVRANRLAAELKVFFKWCAGREGKNAGVILKVDPALSLNGNYYRQTKRTRVLSDDELQLWLRALASQKPLYRRALLLLLLTGCRRGEVCEALSSERQGDVWTIPAERVKNSVAHVIPLSPWGVSLMQVNTRWLVPAPRLSDQPLCEGWINKIQEQMRTRMMELGGCAVEHFVVHDLRRTMRSNTRRLGIDTDTAEAMLNHKKTGLLEIYDHYGMLEEKREGFARWERHIASLARAAGVESVLGAP